MTSPRYAELAARVISDGTRADTASGPVPRDRARTVAAIERALAGRRRRLTTRRFALAGAFATAVAASVALFVTHRAPLPSAKAPAAATPTALALVSHPSGAGGVLEVEGRSTPLVDGDTLAKGSRIVTSAGGGATLALSTGTKLRLDEKARLAFEGEGEDQIFSLSAGAVEAQVAKLSGSQRFLVRTSDSEVEVRGTAFRVSEVTASKCGGGAVTRVAVSEGVVVVRFHGNEFRVGAGEVWPADCAPEAARPQVTPPPARRPGQAVRQAAAPTPLPTAPVIELLEPSQLADQNDMFARAAAARRAGQHDAALRGFDALLQKYPRGPLAESATVERLRALRKVDPGRAKAAARDYVARYPNGFAKGEAEATLEESK